MNSVTTPECKRHAKKSESFRVLTRVLSAHDSYFFNNKRRCGVTVRTHEAVGVLTQRVVTTVDVGKEETRVPSGSTVAISLLPLRLAPGVTYIAA
ncbi:protein of unknown function [Pararobbsia alpina]